jgi:hypothetical protein
MLATLGAVLAAVAIVAGTAIAGHLGAVKSYTGCLAPKDGVIVKVKQGNEPASPCAATMTEVHLSGGDITKISVTGALTGGGDNGEVTIGLKPEFTLPTGCATGDVVEWNGSAWVCGVDNDTTYSEGTGLDLSGTTFSIDQAYRVKNTADCSSGQFATGFDSDGDIQCAALPASAGVQAYAAHVGHVILAGKTIVISKTVPPGKYLLTASVDVANLEAADASVLGECAMPGYTQDQVFIEGSSDASISLTSAIAHAGGAIELTCTEQGGDVDVLQAGLTALKVDSVG